MRPFSIIEDEGFKILIKTGQPNHYIPKRHTVARNMKQVFKKTHKRIQKMLKVWSNLCAANITESDLPEPQWSVEFRD